MQKPSPEAANYLPPVFLGSMAFVFINFGLPIRADELGIGAFGIGGMYAMFTGTLLLVRPLIGYGLDRFGRRGFFVSAFLFYGCAMGFMAISVDVVDFYLARFLQGIGAGLMWVSVRTLIADLNGPAHRGEAMGRLTVTSVRGSMFGAMYGFTLLGFLPLPLAWVWAFGGYALMALMGAAWAWATVVESRPKRAPESTLGSVSWNGRLVRLLVMVFLSAFASALIEPIYLLFLKHKFELPLYALALAFLPAGLVMAVVPRYAGEWSDQFGRGRLIALGVTCAGFVSIALPHWSNMLFVGLSYMLFAFGWAVASPAQEALVADLAPAGTVGRIMGVKEAAAGIGAALGPLVGGLIYDYWTPDAAFAINGVLLLLTAVWAWVWFARDVSR